MTRIGSPRMLSHIHLLGGAIVALLMALALAVGGCGNAKPPAKSGSSGDGEGSQQHDSDGREGGSGQDENIEPADHDIEVPPAP